jgi:large subunit ribosomal protein L29
MKTKEYVNEIRARSAADIKAELAALRKEQFNLRMQKAMGQLNQSHLIGEVRKKIARAKTVLRAQVANGQAKAS